MRGFFVSPRYLTSVVYRVPTFTVLLSPQNDTDVVAVVSDGWDNCDTDGAIADGKTLGFSHTRCTAYFLN